MEVKLAKELFTETYGSAKSTCIVSAPGRVNLIGEHTDYCEVKADYTTFEKNTINNQTKMLIAIRYTFFSKSKTEMMLTLQPQGKTTHLHYLLFLSVEKTVLSKNLPNLTKGNVLEST